jgi:hypothetical protein
MHGGYGPTTAGNRASNGAMVIQTWSNSPPTASEEGLVHGHPEELRGLRRGRDMGLERVRGPAETARVCRMWAREGHDFW